MLAIVLTTGPASRDSKWSTGSNEAATFDAQFFAHRKHVLCPAVGLGAPPEQVAKSLICQSTQRYVGWRMDSVENEVLGRITVTAAVKPPVRGNR